MGPVKKMMRSSSAYIYGGEVGLRYHDGCLTARWHSPILDRLVVCWPGGGVYLDYIINVTARTPLRTSVVHFSSDEAIGPSTLDLFCSYRRHLSFHSWLSSNALFFVRTHHMFKLQLHIASNAQTRCTAHHRCFAF